jgi:hypothetical protein
MYWHRLQIKWDYKKKCMPTATGQKMIWLSAVAIEFLSLASQDI